MLRNGCRYLTSPHVFTKTSRTCRLCCASTSDCRSYVHSSGDKHRNRHPHAGVRKPKVIASKPKELFKPVIPQPLVDDGQKDIGEEVAGHLSKNDKLNILNQLVKDSSIQMLASQHDITGSTLEIAFQSFRKFILQSAYIPVDMHVVFKDIILGAGHITDLFPFFLNHAQTVFPHLNCMEDLRKISDLSDPSQWYPLARSFQRKIIYHSGPTNSGKTYHALKSFMESKSGVYCGPLRLLAMEVFDKCNNAEVPCDLITGETRMFAHDDESPADHVACTVEMMNMSQEYDVAVIDEIQMIGDIQRGWSWTRALLGIAAREIHVCGEDTAIELVQNLAEITGDLFEVKKYERLTSLTYLNEAVGSFADVKAGDCIVCFSKKDIFKVYDILSAKGHKCAVIYGDLPPGTKIMQSRKFNDPDDPCSIMVATDAVGMGLNLAIKRVVFWSIMKRTLRDDGLLAMSYLSTSQAQQIGGRAGRFRTAFEHGEVTTFWAKDLPILKQIVNAEKYSLQKAGLNPTSEMIEMFSYYLPKASLSNLLDIFVHVSKLDDLYFMCNLTQFKDLADLIEHVPLPLRTRYTFCSSPLKVRKGFAQVMFVKIAKQFCLGLPLTYEWLCTTLGAPFSIPKSVAQLEQLEGAFDIVDIYLWLSYRYPDMFVDAEEVRELRVKLDSTIQAFLNKSRKIERKRGTFTAILDETKDTSGNEVDAKVIENNPLQAYKPKHKKREEDKVFADAFNEMHGLSKSEQKSTVTAEGTEHSQEINVTSFWNGETVGSFNSADDELKDTAFVINKAHDDGMIDNAVVINETLGNENSVDDELKDSAYVINETLEDEITPEIDQTENEEEKLQRFSKVTGSYEAKTMPLTKNKKLGTDGVKITSGERKPRMQASDITKAGVEMGGSNEEIPANTTKLGMKMQEIKLMKELLTQIKKTKISKKVAKRDEFSMDDLDDFVTLHKPHTGSQLDDYMSELDLNMSNDLAEKVSNVLEKQNNSNQKSVHKDKELITEDDKILKDKAERLDTKEDVNETNLTENLIKQGVLTETMLENLKQEWQKSLDKNTDHNNDSIDENEKLNKS
ncbi:ATP-dependent RNA helicase supv3l1 [Mactra antiquata]